MVDDNSIKKYNGKAVTLVPSGLDFPDDIAVDNQDNIYIADTGSKTIKKYDGRNVTTIVSSGLGYPYAVDVDNDGNVYIADRSDTGIRIASGIKIFKEDQKK